MLKLKSMSFSSRINSKPKQHCKEDEACHHCCSCWVKFKKSIEGKLLNQQNNITKLKEQNVFLTNVNRKMAAELQKLEKARKELHDLDQLKEKIKQECGKQLQNKKNADDIILRQKVKSLKEERESNIQLISSLRFQIQEFQQQTDKLRKQNQQLHKQNTKLNDLYSSASKELSQKTEIIKKQTEKLKQLNNFLKDKTLAIERLTDALKQSQNNYFRQKVRAENQKFQNIQKKHELKAKQVLVSNLVKQTEQKIENIQMLETATSKLSHLVKNMDYKILEQQIMEDSLKERLLMAEDYAFQKEQKLQMLKTDVRLMKYYL